MICEADAERLATAYRLGPHPRLSGPVARGVQGQVWRLDTDRGGFAVKEPFGAFAEVDPDQASRQAEFQRLARAAGVPAPEVLATATGPLLGVGGVPVRVYTWVDVLELDTMLDPAAVGRLVAGLHAVHQPADGPVHWWYTEPVGRAEWEELLAGAEAAAAPYADALGALLDDLVAVESIIGPVAPVQTCHLDLWADNLRATPDGGLCLLDWENAGPGDPAGELALALFEFGRSDPDRAAALHAAYVAAGGPARVRSRRDFGMVAAQLGHILRMHLRAHLDPAADAAGRRRARRGVDEALAEPLTLGLVDALLDAVTP
jgi:aminoglycoside phosphotransferase (APT) family kinase protein